MKCSNPYISPHIVAPVPCGKCLGCRINTRKGWVLRMILESKYHEFVSFVTLTYDDDHIPYPPAVSKIALQNYLKRLRYYSNCSFSYYACGEYGERSLRPHYHAIIFGPHTSTIHLANDLAWKNGFHFTCPAGPDAMSYVAGYVAKKKPKDFLEERGLTPEFTLSSRRPAIGLRAIDEIVKLSQNDADVVSVFNVGGVRYYLPRYLKRKAREVLYNDEYISQLTDLFVNGARAENAHLIRYSHTEDIDDLHRAYKQIADKNWGLRQSYQARQRAFDIDAQLKAKI